MQDFNSEKLTVIKNNNNKINVYYDHNPFFFCLLVVKKVTLKNIIVKSMQYLDLKVLNI